MTAPARNAGGCGAGIVLGIAIIALIFIIASI